MGKTQNSAQACNSAKNLTVTCRKKLQQNIKTKITTKYRNKNNNKIYENKK